MKEKFDLNTSDITQELTWIFAEELRRDGIVASGALNHAGRVPFPRGGGLT